MFELYYNFLGLNQQLFLLINHTTNVSILPYILQIISWLFGIANFAVYYILLCMWAYFNSCNTNTYNKLARFGIIYTVFGLTYAALKFQVNLPRPFCSLASGSFITIVNTSSERCLSSFPSSHTGLALLLTYFIWEYLTWIQKIVALLVVVAVGISRITLAMHYPADIIYSLLIAILVIMLGNMLFKLFEKNLIKKVGRFVVHTSRSCDIEDRNF
jgi:membrane-associated phospholipid phosphatase